MYSKQSGVALITVLLVFALAAVVLTDYVSEFYFQRTASQHFFDTQQARELALSGEELARQFIFLDLRGEKTRSNNDHFGESWAKTDTVFNVPDGFFEIQIEDLQGRFNLNNLVDDSGAAVIQQVNGLQRMLSLHKINPEFALAIADWIDRDEQPMGSDSEDRGYGSLNPPYKTANQRIASATEILLAKGAEPLKVQHLLYALTALPETTKVNINTASAEVILSLHPTISPEKARNFVVARKKTEAIGGYLSADALLVTAGINDPAFTQDKMTVSSNYFQVRVRAKFDTQYVFLVTTLYRDPDDGQIVVISRDWSQRFQFPYSKDIESTSRKDTSIDI